MEPSARQAYWRIGLVVVLAAVLALLAILQYRWSLEISQAERTRIEASLNTSVNLFRQEFYHELTQVTMAFHRDPMAEPDDFWSSYAERYQAWERTAAHPDLVANVYVWRASGPESSQLLMLRTADGQFQPAEWPGAFSGLRTRLADEAQQPPPGPGGPPELRSFAWTLETRIPALVHPIFNFARPRWRPADGSQPRGGTPPRMILGVAIVELNRAALDKFLGELAQRYFSGPDGFTYNVAVVSAGRENQIIYRSDAQITTASLNPPDARATLLRPIPDMRADAGPGEPPPGPRESRGRRGGNRGAFPARGRGAFILPSLNDEPWQLWARHKAGSLETVVAIDRRRNLFLSFGVLLLLAVSMTLIVLSSQRARRLARLQIDFVAGVSHELRTPVAVICSAADNLAEGFVGTKEQVKEYGAVIRNEGRRLAGMIEQILHFASGQSRPASYELAPVAVSKTVNDVLASVSALPEAQGFAIEREIDADLPPVKADPTALARCLENLVLNAFKYGGESRWLRVRAAKAEEGTRVRIHVEDRGSGIDPADLPHIFEPFFRGRAAQAAQIHGAGLGLSLARDIAERMGGRLEVSSAPGRGSTFTVDLAAAVPPEPAPAEPLPRTA